MNTPILSLFKNLIIIMDAISCDQVGDLNEMFFRYKTRFVRHNIEIPYPPMKDNPIRMSMDCLFKGIDDHQSKDQIIESLNSINSSKSSFIKSIIRLIDSEILMYGNLWEVLYDLTVFSQQYHDFLFNSANDIGISVDLIPHLIDDNFEERVLSIKPEGASLSTKVSNICSIVEDMPKFERFVYSRSYIPLCPYCYEPVSYYSFPCSHPQVCDACFKQCKPSLCLLPNCQKEIHEFVRVDFSK